MSKLERLLNLTAVLLNAPRPLSAEELRTRVDGYPPPGPAFHRAFERDKDDLRTLGIPLRVERVPATDPPLDGYRIDPDEYYLPEADLEPDELAALHLAMLTIQLDGVSDREALWKLGGIGGEERSERGRSTPAVASLPSDPSLVPLFQAIVDRRQVGFGYRGEARTVDPWRLDFHRGRWYLTGHDHLRAEERNFRLDRIETAVTVEGPATAARPVGAGPDRPVPPWELGSEEPTLARVWIDADQVASARQQLGEAVEMESSADGSAVFTIPVVNVDAFRTFLLGFLHRAELLSPQEWRDDLVAWLSAIEARR